MFKAFFVSFWKFLFFFHPLVKTCRKLRIIFESNSLWSFQIRKHIGEYDYPHYANIQSNLISFKVLFFQLRLYKLSVAKFSIIWKDGSHWRIKRDPLSEFGEVAHLNSVCWLELNGTMNNVKKGRYAVLWRMNFHTESALNFDADWTVKASDQDQEALVFHWNREHQINALENWVGTGWCLFSIGVLNLYEDSAVNFRILGGNPNWFGNWSIDYVRLKPIFDVTEGFVEDGSAQAGNVLKDEASMITHVPLQPSRNNSSNRRNPKIYYPK